jgi:hypothetical protein
MIDCTQTSPQKMWIKSRIYKSIKNLMLDILEAKKAILTQTEYENFIRDLARILDY